MPALMPVEPSAHSARCAGLRRRAGASEVARPGWPGAYFGLKTRFLFLTMPPAAQEISAFSRAYKIPQYLLSAKSAWLAERLVS